jgi:membrane protease YdiL (CAAX protease family)
MQQAFHRSLPLVTGPLLVLAWAVLGHYYQTTGLNGLNGLTAQDQLRLLGGTAYLCFLCGALGLRLALGLQRKKLPPPLPIFPSVLAGFIFPAVVISLPDWGTNPFGYLTTITPENILFTKQPLMPTLQAISLAVVLLTGNEIVPGRLPSANNKSSWLMAALAGLGLWLAAVFTYQLINLAFKGNSISPYIHGYAILSAVLLPLFEGIFFRGRILRACQTSLGRGSGRLLCACFSAALTFQPPLFAPAFLTGFGLNCLADQENGLSISIIAHTAFNIISLLIVPVLIH